MRVSQFCGDVEPEILHKEKQGVLTNNSVCSLCVYETTYMKVGWEYRRFPKFITNTK